MSISLYDRTLNHTRFIPLQSPTNSGGTHSVRYGKTGRRDTGKIRGQPFISRRRKIAFLIEVIWRVDDVATGVCELVGSKRAVI